ncbi:MAG TPA: lipid-A-disaccharide synthase [Gammaproteobacteria bacterium]|nr:lipid-A-disaccharide synthase [Gammaproteobacteria bacterium]
MSLKIGIVAGEASGDILAAGMLEELARRDPAFSAEGIAGPGMQAAGCRSLWPLEKLSVMGLVEVLKHLPELLKLRRDVVAHFAKTRPDVFIGVDSPDFNLGLARRLKARGIRTAQYVSPSVWAWREGRAEKIGRSVDRVLCLFPFEPEIYARHGVDAVFVGHPLADLIPLQTDRAAARRALGLPETGRIVALLPGSRMSEVTRLAEPFLATAAWLRQREPDVQFVVPAATARLRAHLEQALAAFPGLDVTITDGQSREVMTAADCVLLASGTAALEAMLLRRPMVVAYKVSALTYLLVRSFRLLKLPYVSLPNVLAGRRIVPEYLQHDAEPERLGPAVQELLAPSPLREEQMRVFGEQHLRLRCNANARAAEAVLDLAGRSPDK